MDGVHDGTVFGAGGVGTAGSAVTPGEVFGDAHPFVEVNNAVVVESVLLVEGIDERTLVIIVGIADAVACQVVAGVDNHVVTLVERCAEDFVHPVGTLYADAGVKLCVPALGEVQPCVGVAKLGHINLLLGGEGVGNVRCHTGSEHSFVRNAGGSGLRLLGGDEDNAAGSRLCTVDGCRSGVLQHGDGFDIVHRGDGGSGHSVNYPQHVVAVGRTLAADDDVGSGGGVAAVGLYGDTGNLALKHGFGGTYRTCCQFFGIVDDADAGRKVLLAGLGTVSEDNDFAEAFGILLKHHIHGGGSGKVLGTVAHIADGDGSPGLYLEGEVTFIVSNGSVTGAFLQNGSAYYGFAIGVGHMSFDHYLLLHDRCMADGFGSSLCGKGT